MLIRLLENNGHEAYAVGGCIRDALLGTAPNDWDLTTSASPDEVKDALSELRILDTGLKHGTVSAVLDSVYEITTFRIDGKYSDSRHPDTVSFSKRLEDDLSRRDFTINAMAYNDECGLVDVFGGAEDLENGVIKCVGDPEKRMDEDALRILRAARFQSRLGFSIDPDTKKAILNHIPQLSFVSKERIGSEFRQLVSAPFASKAIRENKELVFAAAPELRGAFELSPYPEPGVFEKTMKFLEQSHKNDRAFPVEWADENVRLALLFLNSGGPHLPGQSSVITRKSMRDLKYSNELTGSVTELVLMQDAPLEPERPCARRLMGKLFPAQLKRLLKLKECVAITEYGVGSKELEDIVKFYELVKALHEEHAAIRISELEVNGKDLIGAGLESGRLMGNILKRLLDEVIDEKLKNNKAALLERAKELQNEFK